MENSDKCLWTFQLESNTTYSSQFYRHLQKSFSFAPLTLRSFYKKLHVVHEHRIFRNIWVENKLFPICSGKPPIFTHELVKLTLKITCNFNAGCSYTPLDIKWYINCWQKNIRLEYTLPRMRLKKKVKLWNVTDCACKHFLFVPLTSCLFNFYLSLNTPSAYIIVMRPMDSANDSHNFQPIPNV